MDPWEIISTCMGIASLHIARERCLARTRATVSPVWLVKVIRDIAGTLARRIEESSSRIALDFLRNPMRRKYLRSSAPSTVLSRTSRQPTTATESLVVPGRGGGSRISGPHLEKSLAGHLGRRTIETQTTMNDYITPATAATLELVERVLPFLRV